jgi:hypothetical protein
MMAWGRFNVYLVVAIEAEDAEQAERLVSAAAEEEYLAVEVEQVVQVR